jgi:hypothetical protein
LQSLWLVRSLELQPSLQLVDGLELQPNLHDWELPALLPLSPHSAQPDRLDLEKQ